MVHHRFLSSLAIAGAACALSVGATLAQAQQYDAPPPDSRAQPVDDTSQSPGRVARLAYLSGQVQFAPAGVNDWGSVDLNRPMVIGDRLLTGDDGRAVLELGEASVRIDNDSAFDFLNLTDDNVQIELSQGTLNLAVRQLGQGANFEVDTPTVAFVAATPGIYRIDDNPDGTGSMVTVFQGSGTVYGENGVSREVVAGTAYRFNDSALASVDVTGLPEPDAFDRFCEARDATYQRYAEQPQQQQYVPPDMIGGDDLYQYGQWDATPQYGNVWYPTTVPVGWAPYRFGHWAWIDPWGWTWVDNQPWGFAPFHYGRWVNVRNRWGWCPGPIGVRPVYAPALVAFVGGSGFSVSIGIGRPVGWFPLGPRDVYVPWFHASRRYFTNVNVTNIRNVYVNKTVINNYYADYRAGRRPPFGRNEYAYRRLPGAVTMVPRNVFTGARPIHPAVLKLNRGQLARTDVALRPDVNPDRSSLGLRRPTSHPAVLPGREPFARPVVARHEPPPRPVDFATRERVIAGQHGQPLTTTQLRNLRDSHPTPATRNDRVRLVPTVAGRFNGGTTPPRPAEPPARAVTPRDVGAAIRPDNSGMRREAVGSPSVRGVVTAGSDVGHAVTPASRPNELPSARFARPGRPGTLPQVPVIRPADESQQGRLPVVRPVEPAARALGDRTGPALRSSDFAAQQRARDDAMRPQRGSQAQPQEGARNPQFQPRRDAQASNPQGPNRFQHPQRTDDQSQVRQPPEQFQQRQEQFQRPQQQEPPAFQPRVREQPVQQPRQEQFQRPQQQEPPAFQPRVREQPVSQPRQESFHQAMPQRSIPTMQGQGAGHPRGMQAAPERRSAPPARESHPATSSRTQDDRGDRR